MYKISVQMIQKRCSVSDLPSIVTTPFSPVKDSLPRNRFRSIFNRYSKSPEPDFQLTEADSSPLYRSMALIKDRIPALVRYVERIIVRIPAVLGIIGGCYALWQIYLSNVERPAEKLEVLVLRRSNY